MAEKEKNYLNPVDFIIMEENDDILNTDEAEILDNEVDDQQQSSKTSLNEKCHTLVIRQATNLHTTERNFFCMECKKDFQTIKAFSEAHEMLDNNEVDNIVMDDDSASVKWEEDFDEITEEQYQLSEYNVIDSENDYEGIDEDEDENENENADSKEQYKNDNSYNEDAETVFDVLDEDEDEDEDEEAEVEVEGDEELINNYKAKFFCTDCETVFNEYSAAETHVCTALNKSINKKHNKSKSNAVEVKETLDEQRYVCGNCGLNLNSLDNLEKHFHKCTENSTVENNNVFLCDKCPKKFTSISGLSDHAKTHKANSRKKTTTTTHSNLQNADVDVKLKSNNNLSLKISQKKNIQI